MAWCCGFFKETRDLLVIAGASALGALINLLINAPQEFNEITHDFFCGVGYGDLAAITVLAGVHLVEGYIAHRKDAQFTAKVGAPAKLEDEQTPIFNL
jgi:hypothetical protein